MAGKNNLRDLTVMIDLDYRTRPRRWATRSDLKEQFFKIAGVLFPGIKWKCYYRFSPSGKGIHFWATAYAVPGLKGLSAYQILLAQCLMGSDIGRERANLIRIASGVKDWNRLFSTKRISLYPKRLKKS